MSSAPLPVTSEADILPAYRDTPVADLLRYQNLGAAPRAHARAEILVSTCLEGGPALRVPAGFAVTLHTGAGSLKRVPFKVSWAVGIAGVRAIAVVGHGNCGLVGLRGHREEFVERLMAAGWERPAAEQHFDHWSDLFEIDDPAGFAAAEAARLRHRYPRLTVAPLLLDPASGRLLQIPG